LRNSFGIRLRLADQRLQPGLQISGRHLIKAVVGLAGINQILAFSLAQPADSMVRSNARCHEWHNLHMTTRATALHSGMDQHIVRRLLFRWLAALVSGCVYLLAM